MNKESSKQFSDLQKQFIANLDSRKQRFNHFYLEVSALALNKLEVEALVSLHREAHNLTGTAGCYQLVGLSELSRKLENHLWAGLRSLDKSSVQEGAGQEGAGQEDAWQEKLYKYFTDLMISIDELSEKN